MNRVLWLASAGLIAASPLLAQEPKLRGTLRGHSHNVNSVAWSPDGKTLVSGSSDATIRLWNVASGKNTATLKAPEIDWRISSVRSVAYGPLGKTLVSANADHMIRLWEVASGKITATLEEHDEVDSVAWSPDGETLVSISDRVTIRLWDVSTGKNTATLKVGPVWINSLTWNPDGKTLVTGDVGGTIKLWDVANGKNTASFETHDLNVLALAYSPDGRILASGSVLGRIKLWSMAGRTKIAKNLKGHFDPAKLEIHVQLLPAVCCVAFSPDGKTLASGSQDKTIKLWDVASGKNIATLKGHSGSVESVAFSPDGKTLASASGDKTIRLWDLTTLEGNRATERSSGREKDSPK